jgi:hypothetical protein
MQSSPQVAYSLRHNNGIVGIMKFASKWIKADWLVNKTISNESFRKWNATLALLFLVQGSAILLFGAVYNVPINVLFLTGDSLQTQLTHHMVMALAIRQLYMLNVAYLIAAYFFIAAIVHLFLATFLRVRYEAALKKSRNTVRWIEFSISAGVIFILVSVLAGIYDVGSLFLISLFGMLLGISGMFMEQRIFTSTNSLYMWLIRLIAIITGVAPLLVIVCYIMATNMFGSNHAAVQLYWIMPSLIVLFSAFGYNA